MAGISRIIQGHNAYCPNNQLAFSPREISSPLLRSDNLDELAKLSVIVSLIFLGNVAYYPHHEVGK